MIAIFRMSNEWIFSLSTTFLSQTIFKIFKFLWSFTLSFISLLMITFWLLVSIVMCISCASTAKIQCIICVKFAILFAHVWNLFRFAQVSELTAWSMMFSLSSFQKDMIRFLWAVDTFTIENILYTLHATYIKHNFYANFSFKLKKLLKEFSYDKFTVQNEWNLSLLKFQQFTS